MRNHTVQNVIMCENWLILSLNFGLTEFRDVFTGSFPVHRQQKYALAVSLEDLLY